MKTFVAFVLLLSVPALADHPPPPAPPGVPHRAGPADDRRPYDFDDRRERREVRQRLERVESLIEEALRKMGPGPAMGPLQQARGELQSLKEDLRGYADGPRRPDRERPSQPPMAHPASEPELGALLTALGREARGADQLRVLQQASSAHLFLVEQAARLLGAFRTDVMRLRAAAALCGRLVDPQNAFQLYNVFPSPLDKAILQRLLAADPSAGPVPLSQPELNPLLAELRNQGSSHRALKLLERRASSYHFTTTQVRMVTDALFSPFDRMKAVRALRGRILDPENTEPLATGFSSSHDQEQVRRLLREVT